MNARRRLFLIHISKLPLFLSRAVQKGQQLSAEPHTLCCANRFDNKVSDQSVKESKCTKEPRSDVVNGLMEMEDIGAICATAKVEWIQQLQRCRLAFNFFGNIALMSTIVRSELLPEESNEPAVWVLLSRNYSEFRMVKPSIYIPSVHRNLHGFSVINYKIFGCRKVKNTDDVSKQCFIDNDLLWFN